MLYNSQGQAVEAASGTCLLFTPRDNGIHIFSSAERNDRLRWPNHEDKLIAPFELVENEDAIPGCCPEIAMVFAMISGYSLQRVSAQGAPGFAYEFIGKRHNAFSTQKRALTRPGVGHLARFDLKSTALIILDSDNESIRWPNLDDKQIINWADISKQHIQDFIIRMIFAGTSTHPIRLTSADHTYLLEEEDERQHR